MNSISRRELIRKGGAAAAGERRIHVPERVPPNACWHAQPLRHDLELGRAMTGTDPAVPGARAPLDPARDASDAADLQASLRELASLVTGNPVIVKPHPGAVLPLPDPGPRRSSGFAFVRRALGASPRGL